MKFFLCMILMLTTLSSAFANVSGGSQVFSNSRNHENTQVLITGKAGQALFEKLNVNVVIQNYHNIQFYSKSSEQFSCHLQRYIVQTVPATPDSYYCVILVDPVGRLLGIDQL